MDIPEGKYLGTLCKRGHEWEDSGKSLRYKKARQGCCLCNREAGISNYNKNRKYISERRKNYRILFGDKVREKERLSRTKNREENNKRAREYCRTPKSKASRKKWTADWYRKNKERIKASTYLRDKSNIENLSDRYVKQKLHMSNHYIPNGLIVAKRETLKLHRLIKKVG